MTTVYTTGTITVSNGSTTVTGSGTAWNTAGIKAGDHFWGAGLSVRVASVDSATQITLAYAWPGSSLSGANYEIRLVEDDIRALAASNLLLQALGANGNLTSLGNLSTAANKLPYFTGAGVAAVTDLTAAARTLLDDASVAAMQTTLELVKTTSATDTTAGRLLKARDAGLLVPNGENAPEAGDANTLPSGLWRVSGNTTNAPAGTGVILAMSQQGGRAAQIYVDGVSGTLHTRGQHNATWGAWRVQFDRGNILGNVSESSGVPTGALFQYGFVSGKGHYLRLADGTQVCWHLLADNAAINVAFLGGFRDAGRTWTFPIAFASAPVVSGSPQALTSAGVTAPTSTTTAATVFHTAFASQAAANLEADLIAIGRWY